MKKRQIMALICSMFFFNLLPFSLPARGQRKENCGRYPKVYTDKYETCLVSTKYNQHGVIYGLGIPNTEADFLIYKGKSGDAILEEILYCGRVDLCPSKPKREYGTWRKTGQYYLFRFPRDKIYIPIP
ncbi:hypothetical protein VV11_020420 [Trichodesmium erythraeum 21-75]|nr:hypothetical protein [Trichodesmium erythraeum 21-75]